MEKTLLLALLLHNMSVHNIHTSLIKHEGALSSTIKTKRPQTSLLNPRLNSDHEGYKHSFIVTPIKTKHVVTMKYYS